MHGGRTLPFPNFSAMTLRQARPRQSYGWALIPRRPLWLKCDGVWRSLLELISKNPQDILGEKVAEKFDNRLPYLFKVLAAAKPLSIQAHPSLIQAKEGFERENRLRIPLDALSP